jgi:RimJ/RimL family protein N-acetyltransferase
VLANEPDWGTLVSRCNALNAALQRAAERFDFTFEGVFRKHQVVKAHYRDTAWNRRPLADRQSKSRIARIGSAIQMP